MSNFKKQAFMLKDLLKEKGCKVPLVSVQEALAKSYGYKNRHVAIDKEENFKKAFRALHSQGVDGLNQDKKIEVSIILKGKKSIDFKTKGENSLYWLSLSQIHKNNIPSEIISKIIVKQEEKEVYSFSYEDLLSKTPKKITRENISNLDFYFGEVDCYEDFSHISDSNIFDYVEKPFGQNIKIFVNNISDFSLQEHFPERMDKDDVLNWEGEVNLLESIAHTLCTNTLSEFEFKGKNIDIDSMDISPEVQDKLADLCVKVQNLVYEEMIKSCVIRDVECISDTGLIYAYSKNEDCFILQEKPFDFKTLRKQQILSQAVVDIQNMDSNEDRIEFMEKTLKDIKNLDKN